jgi:PAS domain S-box-containing protein
MSTDSGLYDLRALYFAMVEASPAALLVLDVDTRRFVEVNPAGCRLFDHTREELLELGPGEVSPPRQPDGRPSAETAMGYIREALEGGKPIFEWTHQSRTGEPRPCRIQLTRVPIEGRNLVRGSLTDIRGQRGAEADRDRFQAVLDATPDFVGMGDAQGRVLYLNAACRKALGIAPDEDVTGSQIASYHPPEYARRIPEEMMPIVLRDGVWHGESVLLGGDGAPIPVSQVVIAHRDAEGNVDFLSTIMRDISDRLALEQQALHAQKLDSLGIMAGGIAHDFNNILVGIVGNLSLMQAGDLDENERQETIQAALEAGRRAAELAQEMLSYAGKAQLEVEPVSLPRVAADIQSLVTASVSKKAKLHWDWPEHLPPVMGDPTQLRQVFMNLVLNASDSLGDEPGEVRVKIGPAPLDRPQLLHSYLPDDAEVFLYCEVSDTGDGILPENAERIFDPFFTTKFAGRGLGLAAVLGIVKAHRGAIGFETALGVGTTFRILLPAAADCEQATDAATKEVIAGYRGSGTILVVDDEETVRKFMARVLMRCGFTIIEASDGTEALEKLEATAGELVAVVLDLTMPGLDGSEVLARVRRDWPALPVVLVSGYSSAIPADANAFVKKPFSEQELVAAVRDTTGG